MKKKAVKKNMAPSKKSNDEKVFDVAAPGKTVASASGKPVIVTNRSVVRDPMVTPVASGEVTTDPEMSAESEAGSNEQEHDAATPKLRIEPLHSDIKAESKEAASEEPDSEAEPKPADTELDKTSDTEPEEADDAKSSDTQGEKTEEATGEEDAEDELGDVGGEAKKAENKAAAAEAAAEEKRQQEADSAIASKQYFVPINAVKKRRSMRLLILVAIIFIAAAVYVVMVPGKDFFSADTTGKEPPAAKTSKKTEKKTAEAPATIAYSELQEISSLNSNVVLKVPVEYTEQQNSAKAFVYAQRKPGSTEDSYSSISVTMEPAATTNQLLAAKTATTQQLKAKGQAYDRLLTSLRNNGMEATLSDFTDYNKGVAADILPSKDGAGNDAQGKILILFGQRQVYSVIIGADSAVWEANQAVFQEMIDSLVIY